MRQKPGKAMKSIALKTRNLIRPPGISLLASGKALETPWTIFMMCKPTPVVHSRQVLVYGGRRKEPASPFVRNSDQFGSCQLESRLDTGRRTSGLTTVSQPIKAAQFGLGPI